MSKFCALLGIFLIVNLSVAQVPPRLQIPPGAVLVGQARPGPFRPQRLLNPDVGNAPRTRSRPGPAILPTPAPIRPVVEENEEAFNPTTIGTTSVFDDEVNKLGLSALQSAIRQAGEEEEVQVQQQARPSPLPFRPEKPLLRENIRDRPAPVLRQEQPVSRPRPVPIEEPIQPVHVRQQRPRPIPNEEPQVVRQQVRQYSARQQAAQQAAQAAPPPPVFRPQPRPAPLQRPLSQFLDVDGHRTNTRKPPVQILRKYRTDNPDGSISWGYENEDGSFKEETIGNNCITKGKYGYVDPDGTRKEYSYETGHKCDQPELEEEEEELQGQSKQPLQPQARKPQFRPAPIQYAN